MHVEHCSRLILISALRSLGRRAGTVCLDIGVGTFDFYCQLFAQLGYRTIAVEPVPTEDLRSVCRWFGIRLVESCVTDRDGTVDLFLGGDGGGENLNLSSVMPDWWGNSATRRTVRSVTLATLFRERRIRRVACMKLDIEGAEPLVVSQLTNLPPTALPAIVQFEYGGGGTRSSGQGGWAPRYLEGTLLCLRTLTDLGYRLAVVVDSAAGSRERILQLERSALTADGVFEAAAVYGNVVVMREPLLSEEELRRLCEPYRDMSRPAPPERLPPRSRLRLRWNALVCRLLP